MSQIYDSLKGLISPELISRASSFLGESDTKVSSAISSIIPGMLAGILKKGDNNQVRSALQDAGRSSLLSDLGSMFSGNAATGEGMGNKFMNAVLGNRTGDFTTAIASQSGISSASAGKLTAMISGLIAAFLGNRMVNNNMSLSGIISDLNSEKSSFMNMVPSKLNNILGYTDNKKVVEDKTKNIPVKGKSNYSWLVWLILIALLLLLFFWWRSCRRADRTDYVTDRTYTERVDTVTHRTEAPRTRDYTTLELPNGNTIRVYRNGIEEDMVEFLNSDKYKNAKADDLKSRWFHFDDIEFEHNSSTSFMKDSKNQLDNIAAILKNYPDAKIRIAGYADRTGTNAENMDISEERANYIKAQMTQRGIAASRIMTEGFGEEKATHPENAPDSERAEDRQIAIRFVK